jgi:hypothetical protein
VEKVCRRRIDLVSVLQSQIIVLDIELKVRKDELSGQCKTVTVAMSAWGSM